MRFRLAFCDPDNDWLSNGMEKVIGTNNRSSDTDGDGLLDGVEMNLLHTNPLVRDIGVNCIPIQSAGPGGGSAPCEPNGDTTGFGIPSGTVGNIAAGQQTFQQTCAGCHPIVNGSPQGSGFSFSQLKSATSGPPMFLRLTDKALADLVAFLNLSMDMCVPAQNATPTMGPLPTPTSSAPLGGDGLYAQYCSSCHGGQASLGSVSLSKLNSAIQEKQQMRFLAFLTTGQRTEIVNYINSN